MFREVVTSLAVTLLLLCPANAETVQTLYDGKLQVKIPDNYKSFNAAESGQRENASDDRPNPAIPEFVSGGAKAALAKALPDTDPRKTAFRDEFRRDIRAFVRIILSDLIAQKEVKVREGDGSFWMVVPDGASAKDIHKLFCEDFSQQWGRSTFDLFDAKTGIGRCVNVAGAFVAVFTKKVGKSFVVVETMDLVEFVVLASKPERKKFTKMSTAEKWALFKSAANSGIAEKILRSARVKR